MKLQEIKSAGDIGRLEAVIKQIEKNSGWSDVDNGKGGSVYNRDWKKDLARAKKMLKNLKAGLKEDDETPPEADVIDPKAPTDQAPDEDVDAPPVEGEDVGSVSKAEGFVKSKKDMFAFGATRPVTLLTKNERVGGMEITFQYVINPKTGAWSLRACLKGQSDEDMVEFSTGEDPSSLIKSLKKKKKVTPHQLVDNLNPPADKVVKKTEPEESAEKPETDDADVTEI